ncbi:MAG: helix-turn-helix domain-containing protein [Bacteroidales bacterium]|nr:helix-turn-helix domain-containing protein [Bacteroidales bacterium]
MKTEFFIFYNLFVFVNILILSSILIFRFNNPKTNIILALIILCPGLNFFNNIIILSDHIFTYPYSLFIFQGTALTYGFLVYWYTKSMLGQSISWKNPWHYFTLLAILCDIWFGIEFFYLTPEAKQEYLNCLFDKACYPWQMDVINGFAVVSWMGYFMNSLLITLKYEKSAKGFFSDLEKVNISYLKNFLKLVIILNFILIILYSTLQTRYVEYIFIPSIVLVVNIFFLFYAFHKNTVFNRQQYCNLLSNGASLEKYKAMEDPLCQEIKELNKESKQKKYSLSEIEINENYNKILSFLEQQKPYLDPSINLTKFSSALNACSHNISLTINTKFNMNFFDFINYYRIEEAKQILKNFDSNKYSFDTIYSECGFNSKSAFYRAFKKFTGTTPTEYIKQS